MLVIVHTHSWSTPGMPIHEVLAEVNGARIPTVTFHLDRWLGLARQNDFVNDPFYRFIGWFFTVDQCQADWFNTHTAVKGRYLPAGVFGPECYIAEPTESVDVVFVGSKGYHPEYPMRAKLIEWLAATYGDRFRHYGGGGLPTVRGAELNQVYANAKVVVGDTLCLDPDYDGLYFSDRIFETTGRGGMIVHPRLKGLDDLFDDGKHIATFEHGNLDELKFVIDYYLEAAEEREAIRLAGHEHTKTNHTYERRWESLLETVYE